VTVDFEGKIDGEPFRRQGRRLPVPGRRRPDAQGIRRRRARHEGWREQDLPAGLPADYHGKDVAGKTADFLVTVKKIEAATCPK
jgi:trigger factor